MGGLAARWQVCVLAARLIALALRRSEAVTLDTRGVQCALQVAVSLVSAMAAAGFSVPAAAGEIGAGAETAAPHALDGFGSGVREMTIGGGLEDKVVGEVDNWLQRQALAAGAVCRGCIVIEAVSDVLYSLVARRPQEVPSAIPALLQCTSVYLDWIMWAGEHLPLLQRTGTKGGVDQAALCTGGVDAAVESARNFGRLLVELSKDKKRFSKYAAHTLLAFVVALDRHPRAWPALLKDEVVQGIYAVIDTCGKFELQQVHGLLTQSTRPLFQGLVEDFKRSYKYTGEA